MQQLQPVFLVALTSCLVALSWERDDYYDEDEDDDTEAPDSTLPDINGTEIGQYLGSPCEVACNPRLPHVVCNRESRTCECDKKYPVRIGPRAGCGKPLRLGDQCFYERTCSYTDQHASCIQVNHNALCQCKPGYHTVSLQRPTKRVFCSEDLVLLTTDVPTLLGVASGLAVFTFLICFVLKLFSRARFARPRHFANANLAPPILFSSETAGSRRPSNASIHSSASSSRSYSLRRYEREREQRMAAAAAAGHHAGLRPAQSLPGGALADVAEVSCPAAVGHVPSPSPKTAMSTDELLPVLDEVREDNLHAMASTSVASTSVAVVASTSQQHRRESSTGRRVLHGEIGPAIAGPSSSAGVHR